MAEKSDIDSALSVAWSALKSELDKRGIACYDPNVGLPFNEPDRILYIDSQNLGNCYIVLEIHNREGE